MKYIYIYKYLIYSYLINIYDAKKDNVRYRYVIEDEYLIHKKPETIPSKAGICENVEKIFEYVLDNYTEGLDENVAYYVQQKTDD